MDGPNLLSDFLTLHEVTREQCAKHLKVTRTTLYYWLNGHTAPGAASRDDIALWTHGKVPPESWGPHADHRKKDDRPGVEPFPGGGHDQET
jgi:transcriptional regulator with XRE-family HTH domain